MKSIFLLIAISICNFCQGQDLRTIPKDSTINFLELLWKLDKQFFIEDYSDKNYFYKIIALPLSEAQSMMEGEVLYDVYILKGEYGEYPEGLLMRVGSFYKINSLVMEVKTDPPFLHITHSVPPKTSSYRIE